MINSFSKYLVEEDRAVYFAFGRMNPPTIGHGKLLDVLAAKAGRNPYKLFLSQSQDSKDNPLAYSDKIKFVRKMFPKHARNVMINKKIRNPFDALTALYDEGYRKVVMVAGSDRVTEYDLRLNKYNGKQAGHGFYNFQDSIKIVSAGQRDPDAEGADGASGTKQRKFAADNNFTSFSQGLPVTMNTKDARAVFNAVRKGMGLKEEKLFKNHIQLDPVSNIRESYIRDNVFELGEEVLLNRKDGVIGTIQYLGANYLVVESKGERWRCWLDDVSKLSPNALVESKSMYTNTPDWGTPASTKKAKKVTPGETAEGKKPGLWDNIHARRKKGLPPKKPGEEGYPKTLNIEQNEMDRARDIIAKDKQQASDMISREREKDKIKHARILDRARRARVLRQNSSAKP
jgi:hypothetical protein